MARRGPISGLSPVLLLACAGLGAAVYYQWHAPPETRLPTDLRSQAGGEIEPLPPVQEFDPPLVEDFQEMVARPLFMQTRRPPEPAPVIVEDQPVVSGPQGDFVLVGVTITPLVQVALMQQVGQTDILRVGIGQTVNGWELTEILPDRVLLQSGDTAKEVELRDDVPPEPPRQERRRRLREADRRQSRSERRENDEEPDPEEDE